MSKIKEEFYVAKYTKGRRASLVQEQSIDPDKLPILQKIFNVDPNDNDILTRNMFTILDIDEKQAKMLQPYVDLKFDLIKYDYQFSGDGKFIDDWTGNPITERWYSVCEYQKLIPWRFLGECKLDVSVDFLRTLFKNNNNKFDREPTDITFEPKINSDGKYAIFLQPYVPFKFELDKYDYWIEKRAEGDERQIGQEGEDFVG